MSALSKLVALCPPQFRPIIVAILVICICFVLLRPRNKPAAPRHGGAPAPAVSSAGTTSASSRGPMQSISVVGTIVEYRDGRPHLLPGAVEALRRIAGACDIYLVTQLPVDSDELEAATLDVLRSGGVFGTGGCALPTSPLLRVSPTLLGWWWRWLAMGITRGRRSPRPTHRPTALLPLTLLRPVFGGAQPGVTHGVRAAATLARPSSAAPRMGAARS